MVQNTNNSDLPVWISSSNIIVDGGNVVRGQHTVVMCNKVFHENHKYDFNELSDELKKVLEVEKIVFIPWNPNDFIGHADGMVRFIDNHTVLINEFSKHEDQKFQIGLRAALHNAGLEFLELPFYIPDDPTGTSARGLYLNYLQMEQCIFMPTYGLKTDDKALNILEVVFKDKNIIPIESIQIAKDGGVLNCVSWNILK